ncbi:MAG: glycoside hydrolase family 104 protein [Ramlibacter sp.]|nr:glycoside hydrolase family 104 protein [Ramlibacter sp.]
MKWLTAAAAAVLAAYWLTRPAQAGGLFLLPDGWAGEAAPPDEAPPDEVPQLPTVLETIAVTMDPTTYETGTLPGDLAAANERAFLDMLAYAEGTAGRGDDGYNVVFGGGLFASYADHPRRYFTFTRTDGTTGRTSAAGRYQFIAPTWDDLAPRMGLGDFGPSNQDAAALELVRQRGALEDVRAGRFADAVRKVSRTWASLPGNDYMQFGGRSLAQVAAAFESAGGTITA